MAQLEDFAINIFGDSSPEAIAKGVSKSIAFAIKALETAIIAIGDLGRKAVELYTKFNESKFGQTVTNFIKENPLETLLAFLTTKIVGFRTLFNATQGLFFFLKSNPMIAALAGVGVASATLAKGNKEYTEKTGKTLNLDPTLNAGKPIIDISKFMTEYKPIPKEEAGVGSNVRGAGFETQNKTGNYGGIVINNVENLRVDKDNNIYQDQIFNEGGY